MTDFEKWQKEFEEREALNFQTTTPAENAPLSEEDRAVHNLCLQYSPLDLVAAPFEDKGEPAEAHSLSSGDCGFSFKRSVTNTGSVEEAYQQLVGIAEELCEELTLRKWDTSKEFVQSHLDQLRVAHDSGQMEGLASSVVQALLRLKNGCEIYSQGSVKTQRPFADVGELFLLTALSAHEFRLALTQTYDC